MGKYVLAIDEGTSSARAILFDKKQNLVSMAQKEFRQIYPKPGYVEQDPMEIYAAQFSAAAEVIAMNDLTADDIECIGITNQRETTVVWEKKTGKPLYNAIVWQCRRSAAYCEEIKKNKELSEKIYRKTGLLIDAYFSATKIKWILDNVEGVREAAERGEVCFGTIDTWLLFKLTGGKVHATDCTNASRTMLYNITENKWDDELLEYFGIPKSMMPEVHESSYLYGYFTIDGKDIPISGIAGDQQSALFGQLCFNPGESKNTYGTGCFLLMNTGDTPKFPTGGLLTTVAATLEGQKTQYALEGSVFVGGAVIGWLRDSMKLISDAEDSEYFARKAKDTGGVYVVPAFTGLGAPYWDMYARGTIVGLTRASGKNEIIRAALESIAYQTNDIIKMMKEGSGRDVTMLKADGGASANKFLMQFQADISGLRVMSSKMKESTALGAALLAGLQVGFWKSTDEIRAISEGSFNEFVPSMSDTKREKLAKGWTRAMKAVKAWSDENDDE